MSLICIKVFCTSNLAISNKIIDFTRQRFKLDNILRHKCQTYYNKYLYQLTCPLHFVTLFSISITLSDYSGSKHSESSEISRKFKLCNDPSDSHRSSQEFQNTRYRSGEISQIFKNFIRLRIASEVIRIYVCKFKAIRSVRRGYADKRYTREMAGGPE